MAEKQYHAIQPQITDMKKPCMSYAQKDMKCTKELLLDTFLIKKQFLNIIHESQHPLFKIIGRRQNYLPVLHFQGIQRLVCLLKNSLVSKVSNDKRQQPQTTPEAIRKWTQGSFILHNILTGIKTNPRKVVHVTCHQNTKQAPLELLPIVSTWITQ